MLTKYLDSEFEIKTIDEKGSFSGYASVFNVVDRGRDVVVPGAFKRTLAEHDAKNTRPPMLWQHDLREPVGTFSTIREDKKGLYVEGTLLVDEDATAKRVYAHMKAGSVRGLSIGYYIATGGDEWDDAKAVRRLKDIDLHEISLVTIPMNDSARVTAVKAERITTIREFEDFLRDEGGFSHAAAKAIASRGFSKAQSEPRDEDGGLSDLAQLLSQRSAPFQSLITR